MALTQPRQNFHALCESGINNQINMELYASFVYQSMAFYFDRDDVALPGFSKYFKDRSDKEREHAHNLMTYQNKRGGRILFKNIEKPDRDEWGTGLDAMQVTLTLEKNINQSLLDLHKVAEKHDDPQFTDYLSGEFLKQRVDTIKSVSDHITQLKRVSAGLGEYMYDKNTLA